MVLLTTLILFGMVLQSQQLFHLKSIRTFERPKSLEESSLFGYSISYEPKIQSLIVSAPKADNNYIFNINSANETLMPAPMRRTASSFFFGATVKATSDFFVTCGPRYNEVKKDWYGDSRQKNATVGICYVQYCNEIVPHKLPPLGNGLDERNANTQNYKFSKLMDSLGWSIDITSQEELLIGSPVNLGRVSLFKKKNTFWDKPVLLNKISYRNKVFSNFGYSVASGKFFSDEINYVVGTTYGDVGYGRIYIFNKKQENIGAINGKEFGSMFGATMCTAKLGGSALLIGAPAFAQGDAYDVGAVHIYMPTSSSNEMTQMKQIVGQSNGGYFGYAIVNLGDMDGDKLDEIAIAAPYDDEGNGAVYIYTGAGILKGKLLQKIQPEGFKSFGFSLAVVEDSDDNGCNELAVSSLGSSKVVVLYSFAYITVHISANFPNLLNHENKTHFEFQTCLNIQYPEKPKNITAVLTVKIRTTDQKSKLFDADGDGVFTYEIPVIDKKSPLCNNIRVKSDLTPAEEYTQIIAYKISVNLKDNPLDAHDFSITRVLLSEQSRLDLTDQKGIIDCDGKICAPSLKPSMISTISKPYLIGSTNVENFMLAIENVGQTAYSSCAIVSFFGARVIRPLSTCTLLEDGTQLICKPFQPIRNGKKWIIHPIEVDTSLLTSDIDMLKIQYDVYNNCNNESDKTQYTNTFILKSDIDNVNLKNESNPGEVVTMTRSDVNDLGANIEHVYTINNNGQTNWADVKSEVILDNVPYLNYSGAPITISKEKSSGIECSMLNSKRNESKISVFCNIGNLKRNEKTLVVISIAALPNILETKKSNENVRITTTFNLFLKDRTKSMSLATTLQLITIPVAKWIIITASIVGLAIFIGIAFGLYKSGYLKRKNKNKLETLKKDVYRQSVRRSMMRESMRAVVNRRSSEEIEPFACTTENSAQETINELKTKFNE